MFGSTNTITASFDIEFRSFSVAENDDCQSDFVNVWFGWVKTGPFCGATFPAINVSDLYASYIYVTLTSDANVTSTGFEATVTARPVEECGWENISFSDIDKARNDAPQHQ